MSILLLIFLTHVQILHQRDSEGGGEKGGMSISRVLWEGCQRNRDGLYLWAYIYAWLASLCFCQIEVKLSRG